MPANFAETNVGPWIIRTDLAIVSVQDKRDTSKYYIFNAVQIPGKIVSGVPQYRISGVSNKYKMASLPKYVQQAMASVVRRAAIQVHNAEFRAKTGGRG